MSSDCYIEYNYLPTGPQYQPLVSTQGHVPGIFPGDLEIIHVDHETLQRANRDRTTSVAVYPCKVGLPDESCGLWIEGDLKEVGTHLRKYHGIIRNSRDTIICSWLGCLKKHKLCTAHRHVMTHLQVKFSCSNCGRLFSRGDCARAHRRAVGGCVEALIVNVPGPQARIVGLECAAV
ncbi:hypothetical protein PAXINDRAFT_169055 [Paxillus involutus ATCC 200175]|uniref:C2H2-type domain-containing protein n=1 Tax=Paxillus involutus ATCC 200175 TaxID=664439 RepID=A0A0C9TZ38_PAXIN|nr:hypothetical protein PAXINDRAFT_169055 [Paxillus involutus ATCC 200175]